MCNNNNKTALFLGLDNAGKTTILFKLLHPSIDPSRIPVFDPTNHPTSEEILLDGNRSIRIYDMPGFKRDLYKDYKEVADVIVFIVDASDESRLDEAKRYLISIKETFADTRIPIFILGNKKDDISRDIYLDGRLGIETTSLENQGDQPIKVFMTSIYDDSLQEAFSWLVNYMTGENLGRLVN